MGPSYISASYTGGSKFLWNRHCFCLVRPRLIMLLPKHSQYGHRNSNQSTFENGTNHRDWRTYGSGASCLDTVGRTVTSFVRIVYVHVCRWLRSTHRDVGAGTHEANLQRSRKWHCVVVPDTLRKRSMRQCRCCHKPECTGNSDILKCPDQCTVPCKRCHRTMGCRGVDGGRKCVWVAFRDKCQPSSSTGNLKYSSPSQKCTSKAPIPGPS